MAKKQTAGRDRLGTLAPKFAELNDDVLFGEVWSREDKLSPRDRSMVTIAALFSAGPVPVRLCRDYGAVRLCWVLFGCIIAKKQNQEVMLMVEPLVMHQIIEYRKDAPF